MYQTDQYEGMIAETVTCTVFKMMSSMLILLGL
jgi:hypothetical protein